MARFQIGILLLSIFWGVILLFPSQSNLPIQDPSLQADRLYRPEITRSNFGLSEIDYYETSNNYPSWHLHAKTAELSKKDSHADLAQVTIHFTSQSTGNKFVGRSLQGKAFVDRNEVELSDQVEISSEQGYLFLLDSLDYSGRTRLFQSKSPVKLLGPNIHSPSLQISGTGFLGILDQDRFQIKKNVRAERVLPDRKKIKIRAEHGEFIPSLELSIFQKNVTAETPTLKILCQTLKIRNHGEEFELEAEDDVTFYQKKYRGTAQRVMFGNTSDRIILEGKADIKSADHDIAGERIVFYPDEEKVEVEKAKGSLKQ